MAKRTPTYVLTLSLTVETWQAHMLEKRLNIGRMMYNACLGEAWRRYKNMVRDPKYQEAIRMKKGTLRTERLKHVREQYGVGKYALNMYVQAMGQKFKQNIGSQMAQNIAERAFSAMEDVMYGKGKKVHFCPWGAFYSLEEKTNNTGFRYFRAKQQMEWLGLVMPVQLKANDRYAHIALQDRIKYCRLLKKGIRGKNHYFVQFALEGFPPQKPNQQHSTDNNARVGIDMGTSTIAVVDVRVEDMNYKSLQVRAKKTEISEKTGRYKRKKRFGKSIANRAPAMLLAILDHKLKAKGLRLKRIDTAKVKASQFDHFTQTYTKKTLGTRWNHFEQGKVQRDLYSAFLMMNTTDDLTAVSIERANETWSSFFKLHEQEIARIQALNKKQLRSIGL